MTQFNKEDFSWDGSFLMYHGDHLGAQTYRQSSAADRCHPTMLDKRVPLFIARFKYGSKPYKTWINFLVKNFTVEEYSDKAHKWSPLQAMESKGFASKRAA